MYEEIKRIYEQYYYDLYRYVLKLYPEPDYVDDIIQNTFLEALKSIESYKGNASLKTWLFAIAKHQLYRHLRKKKIEIDITELPESKFTIQSDFSDSIMAQQIINKISDLGPPHDEIMRLRLIYGFSFKEIGERVGHTENYCRVNFYRMREKLRKEYEDYGG